MMKIVVKNQCNVKIKGEITRSDIHLFSPVAPL